MARKQEVAPRIAALLGYEPTGPESEDELRNLREEAEPRPEDLAALAAALREAEVVVDDGPWERDDLVLLARSFLAEDQAIAEERSEVTDAVDALSAALADLRVQRDLHRTDRVHLLSLPARARVEIAATTDGARAWDEVEAAHAAVRSAEEAVSRRRNYEQRRSELEGALEEATRLDDEAAAAQFAAELDRDALLVDALTSAWDRVELAEAALQAGRRAEDEVTRRITDRARNRAVHDLAGAVADRLLEAEDALSAAAAVEQASAADLARAEGDLDRNARLVIEREEVAATVDRAGLVNDVDWALLARLAQVRNVGLAGALPLVLDDPFDGLDDDEVTIVLDRLSRMAQTSQIVVATDRTAVLAWAADRPADEVAVS